MEFYYRVYTDEARIPPIVEEMIRCQPKTKLAFAKTHKTGSSTLQNILFRYYFCCVFNKQT